MATGRVPTTANSPLTAKGDLFGYSTTQARVPVGSDGETLVADSSASTGLRWQPAKSVNYCLNSAFNIWQRGTSFTATASSYGPDRWQVIRDGGVAGSTFSRQLTNDTTNLPFIQYAVRAARDSGNTSTNILYLVQSFESAQSIPLAGRTVTLSFYARAGANFSSASSALNFRLSTGTGTDQNLYAGYTGGANPILGNATLTTTWQRFQGTATLASNITEAGVMFQYTPVGTAGANDWFEVTGVQVEIGSIATAFQTATGTLAGELAACQRYYYRFVPNGVNTSWIGSGFAYATGTFLCSVRLPVTMRVNPTSIETSGTASHYRMLVGSTVATASGVPTLDTANWDNTVLAVSTSGLTVGQGGILGFNSTASGYIGFVAEL